jgi:hypothetical protein
MEKKKCTEEKKGYWGTEMAVMQPVVINEGVAPARENVSCKQIPRSRGGDNGKRKPVTDNMGLKWCDCTKPKLVSNFGGRGQAYCIKCNNPWYH